jgi:hypothetical protein
MELEHRASSRAPHTDAAVVQGKQCQSTSDAVAGDAAAPFAAAQTTKSASPPALRAGTDAHVEPSDLRSRSTQALPLVFLLRHQSQCNSFTSLVHQRKLQLNGETSPPALAPTRTPILVGDAQPGSGDSSRDSSTWASRRSPVQVQQAPVATAAAAATTAAATAVASASHTESSEVKVIAPLVFLSLPRPKPSLFAQALQQRITALENHVPLRTPLLTPSIRIEFLATSYLTQTSSCFRAKALLLRLPPHMRLRLPPLMRLRLPQARPPHPCSRAGQHQKCR